MCIHEKMELAKKLQDSGWHLTEEGIKTLTSAVNNEIDPRKIIEEALNHDLRDIGGGALPSKRDDATGSLAGRIVLQVQKVRNIAAPKANEESKAAPRLLQLELTDGQSSLQALELEPVSALSLNIAPGTKIYFRAEKLQLVHGYLLLRPNDFQILGGRVEALYEKWEFARTMLKYARSGRPPSGSSAPPPWVAFGKSVEDNEDRNFKSLAPATDKDKPTKENDEFNTMRNEAIAVASKAGVKKVFGGGGHNLVDHNIKKILEKGYSKEEAKTALQATRNNLERALYNLKRRKDAAGGISEVQVRPVRSERPGREGKRGASLKDEAEAAKPAANATLFDFLTTKLRTTDPIAEAVAESLKTTPLISDRTVVKPYESDSKPPGMNVSERTRFENNVSSSFAANRGGHSGRLPRGGGRNRGGRDERPPRGGGGSYNERGGGAVGGGGGGGSSMRKHETHSRASDQTGHGKSFSRNGQDHAVSSKALSEGKFEHENSVGKDQGNNRRNNERQSNRNGYSRPENGNVSNSNNNNRRRQPANPTSGATAGGAGTGSAPPARANNAYASGSNDEFNTRLNKVVEETANLKLNNSKREHKRGGGRQGGGQPSRSHLDAPAAALPAHKSSEKTQQPAQRQQPSQSQSQQEIKRQQSNANYSQLPNGYTYDPSKIMGFQTKETNEFALSLLKSQGLTIAPANQAAAQSPPQAASKPAVKSNATPTVAASATSFALPQPQPVGIPPPPPPQHFGLAPGDAWVWNSGDLCMAKYWDDGRYYEAEITAVTENTCVVLFLGYGNHEEVLKSDMLPITDAQNRPLTNMPQTQAHQQTRYRTDRQADRLQQQQVYVPPHKREY